MSSAAFDVLGIGNAIVDVISRADDAFLSKHDLAKGSMMLIDEARAEKLYAAMGPGTEVSSGSCGNTMAGVASFGGKGAYVGKVRDDQLGKVFGHDLRAIGVTVREYEVLQVLGARTTNRAIAAELHLSPRTVEKHVASLMMKTGQRDRAALRRIAAPHLVG